MTLDDRLHNRKWKKAKGLSLTNDEKLLIIDHVNDFASILRERRRIDPTFGDGEYTMEHLDKDMAFIARRSNLTDADFEDWMTYIVSKNFAAQLADGKATKRTNGGK